MFFALLSKPLVFAVCLCISGLKKYWYLQHFLRFCIVPAKDVKTHTYSNLQHFVDFEKLKMSEKCVKTALFSDFRYPQNGMGEVMLLETLMSDPDSVQKSPLRDFQLLVWGLRLDLRSLTVALKASNTQGQHFTSVAFRAVANTSRSQALQSQHVLRHTSLA